ncbi:MAG: helix-turn-helix domain-containing protein [Bacteroidota bacterium]
MLQSLSIDPAYQGLLGGRSLPLLQERTQQIPGSVQYTIRRYKRLPDWSVPDEGLMVYQYEPGQKNHSHLELHFCLSGQVYCRQKEKTCDHCQFQASDSCVERIESVDLVSFRYSPQHVNQWVRTPADSGKRSDDILRFERNETFRQSLLLNPEVLRILEGILNHPYSDNLENIFVNAQSQMLLLHALDMLDEPADREEAPFLAQPADREKIAQARSWLIEHIGEPITIKELSRKVAINECYLKKGFRLMYGSTIFDFYQSQRMEHARYLLYEKGISVTDVSLQLGYSSISHFSTAFKKHTGLKPCDLLWRYDKSQI